MNPEDQAIFDLARNISRAAADCYQQGFAAGWAACKAQYDKQRAEQGERLNAARTSEELMKEARP